MLWVAALLATIIWTIGLASGFLGFGIHIFLLAALLSGLAALLPAGGDEPPADEATDGPIPASSVPAPDGSQEAEREGGATPRARR